VRKDKNRRKIDFALERGLKIPQKGAQNPVFNYFFAKTADKSAATFV
jgi:hypothetical protein